MFESHTREAFSSGTHEHSSSRVELKNHSFIERVYHSAKRAAARGKATESTEE
jgi:hypothetical protein